MKTRFLLTVISISLLSVVAAQAASVWVEGENVYKSNFPQNPWAKGDNPKLLSGGDAFGGLANTPADLPSPSFMLYKVTLPEDGAYLLYMRHGYAGHMGELRVRFVELGADGKPVKAPGPEEGWTKLDWDVPVIDRLPNGEHRTIEWTKHDAIKLKKGSYLMDVQCTGPNVKHTEASPPTWMLIDAICLTTEPFTPRGALKPGEQPNPAAKPGGADYY
jgi:hypothetical protein